MHCNQCRAAVKNLRVVIGRVKELRDGVMLALGQNPSDIDAMYGG